MAERPTPTTSEVRAVFATYPHDVSVEHEWEAAFDTLAVDTLVLPSGADLADWDNVRYWALHVRWRGPRTETGRGGYAVTSLFVDEQLSRAGNWAHYVRPFQQRLYRWETFDEALAAARAAVDSYVMNRQTFAQYLARRKADDD